MTSAAKTITTLIIVSAFALLGVLSTATKAEAATTTSARVSLITQSTAQAHLSSWWSGAWSWISNDLKKMSRAADRFFAKHPNLAFLRKWAGKGLAVYTLYQFIKIYHSSMLKRCPWLKHKKGFVLVPHRCEPSIPATGSIVWGLYGP